MLSKKITVPQLVQKKSRGEKLAMLTCYDATFARLIDAAGVDLLLVGDSLGMVIQGQATTVPVTLDDICYHARCVASIAPRAHLVADMPFMSYQISTAEALRNAGRLLKEGGAESVKLEGGEELAGTIAALIVAGIPVMGHIGIRPQSIHRMGGYTIQGKTAADGAVLLAQAKCLEAAGVYALVLEGVAMEVAAAITAALTIPTIGICSGPSCDGQVLVIYDLLGMNPAFQPRFVKRYAELAGTIADAVATYLDDVRQGRFPTAEHGVHAERVTLNAVACS